MTRQYYWWIVTKDERGKPYLLTGGRTEEEARQKGMELLGGMDFELKHLPTTDLRKASSLLKGDRLEQTHDLGKSSQRLGHERSIRRHKAKKRESRNSPWPEDKNPWNGGRSIL
jgi:hypothetical protein